VFLNLVLDKVGQVARQLQRQCNRLHELAPLCDPACGRGNWTEKWNHRSAISFGKVDVQSRAARWLGVLCFVLVGTALPSPYANARKPCLSASSSAAAILMAH